MWSENYMQRALELAAFGGGRVSPNPFVGAVIVAEGRIIGEGYHRRFGEAHAEVNAINSVKDEDRGWLSRATMYVTLEPCSHFGKTPPCSNLIMEKGIPEVVIATEDPFLKRHKSGIEMLRENGINVKVGVMEREARFINRRFFTAHTLHRPFILLKWAQTGNGYIGNSDGTRLRISTPLTQVLMHRERALYDGILAGTNTVATDHPRLSCRYWPSRDERPLFLTFDSERLPEEYRNRESVTAYKRPDETLRRYVERLYEEQGLISLMVEGGRATLQAFLDEGLFDEIRIESAPALEGGNIPAPGWTEAARIRGLKETKPKECDGNIIRSFVKNY